MCTSDLIVSIYKTIVESFVLRCVEVLDIVHLALRGEKSILGTILCLFNIFTTKVLICNSIYCEGVLVNVKLLI